MSEPESNVRKITRSERRRLETRARLVAGAQGVIARKGIDAATIAEITEEADVGLGTFYHHFDSKEAVLETVAAEIAESEGTALDAATADMSDPAEVMATCIRHIVHKVTHDPLWGWFVLRIGMSVPRSSAGLIARSARDLQRGIDAGRFHVSDAATAHAAICGAILGVIHARLSGTAPEDADRHLAGQILQLLGLSADESAAIANRKPPPVARRTPT